MAMHFEILENYTSFAVIKLYHNEKKRNQGTDDAHRLHKWRDGFCAGTF